MKEVSPQNVELGPISPTKTSKTWLTHVNRLRRCPAGSLQLYPLSKEGVEEQLEEGFDIIKEIVKDKRTPDGVFYRVVWQTLGDRTWEPEDNLPPAAIRDYLRTKAAKNVGEPKKKTRRRF